MIWNAILDQFSKIYTLQNEGKAFKTVADMFVAIGGPEFAMLLKTPVSKYFRETQLDAQCA